MAALSSLLSTTKMTRITIQSGSRRRRRPFKQRIVHSTIITRHRIVSGSRRTVAFMVLLSLLWTLSVLARPVVRNIQSTHEFDRLLRKHATETGLPVVVDYYSDSCGPCRMMAPIFKKVAADYVDRAVFVKVDTQTQYELSSRYQVRSLPTFMWFYDGKSIMQQMGGIGEGPLRQFTDQAIRQGESENVELTIDNLLAYYQSVEPNKAKVDIEAVYHKCADMNKKSSMGGKCIGSAANQLARRLRQKYKSMPTLIPRFSPEQQHQQKSSSSSSSSGSTGTGHSSSSSSSSSQQRRSSTAKKSQQEPVKANLELATREELLEELERRLDQERDAQVEDEDEDDDESELDPDFSHAQWTSNGFPERVVIVGGGPAGMAAAIYASRAGLRPLLIAPSMGGQLQGKGVEVENYPGLFQNVTGPGVIAAMRRQAAHFGAVFEDDIVVGVDAGSRPLKLKTNNTGTIETHTLIVATGAESNWLGVPGEWELRGGGVSSCATCDGFLYTGQDVIVVGGGDAAMEDALVLARTSRSVTVVHRRDRFRASKVLADRVMMHPRITVQWNKTVQRIVGKAVSATNSDVGVVVDDDNEVSDLDQMREVVSGAIVKDVSSGEETKIRCDAVFVAIGHTPSTQFLRGVVDFDPDHPGYIQAFGHGHTHTSVPGIFVAGDVSDAIYRQAITSAGSGAAAALDAERYLSENGLGNEEADMEAELLAELLQDGGRHNDGASTINEGYNVYDDAGGRIHGMKESLASEL